MRPKSFMLKVFMVMCEADRECSSTGVSVVVVRHEEGVAERKARSECEKPERKLVESVMKKRRRRAEAVSILIRRYRAVSGGR